MSVLIVNIIQLSLLSKQLELKVLSLLRITPKDLLNLGQVLLGDLVTKELVHLLDES